MCILSALAMRRAWLTPFGNAVSARIKEIYLKHYGHFRFILQPPEGTNMSELHVDFDIPHRLVKNVTNFNEDNWESKASSLSKCNKTALLVDNKSIKNWLWKLNAFQLELPTGWGVPAGFGTDLIPSRPTSRPEFFGTKKGIPSRPEPRRDAPSRWQL